jgi:hypothetical protein
VKNIKTLGELAKIIRSKNAGPFVITFDIMFDTEKEYNLVVESNILTIELFSKLFNIPPEEIELYYVKNAYAIKITMPRPYFQGDLEDGDNYAGQQYPPLIGIEIPGT